MRSSPSSALSPSPLLAAICHDLRAPLASVTMGANYVLQTTQRDDANARSVKILEAMLRSCSQMERLIRNFADLSAIEADAVELRLGPHDAGEMLAVTAASLADSAKKHDVTIEVTAPPIPISVHCDRERLVRAISHVVENAITHAPTSSIVTLGVTEQAGVAAFTVVDRGAGVSPDMKEHLFDRHWHAIRANRAGAGLGLAIARGFVVAHGGWLDADSRPNESTTFTLRVPKNGPHAQDPRTR